MRVRTRRSAVWPTALAAVAAWCAACGSSSISTIAPSGSKCQVTATTTMHSAPYAGATGSVTVSTTRDCTWSATTGSSWITIADPTSGQGDGNVAFRVAPNADPVARHGTVAVNDASVDVAQDAAPCRFTVAASQTGVAASGGSIKVSVTASSSACAWTAASNAPWLAIADGASVSGSGAATIAVASNTGDVRVGSVVVAGETIVIRQEAASCDLTIAPANANFTAAGGTGTVTVTVASGAGCAWTASANVPWISITSGGFGTGNGTVTFAVAGNAGAARSASMTIAGRPFAVTQDAAPCTYSIAPPSAAVPAAGGAGSFTVTARSGCSWTAASTVDWLAITSGPGGNGNGAVAFNVAANSGAARTGTITAGGETFTVTQAAPCAFSIAPASQGVPAAGGTGSVAVTTAGGCAWSATANVPWITVTSGGTGSGSGTVAFTIGANPATVPRSGTLTIAGQTFTVNQDGAPCTFTISPASQSVDVSGGGGSVTVTTGASCSWTAASNNPDWLGVVSGASGTGNGTVTFAAAPNGTGVPRSGTLSIAGQVFTVNQGS